LGGRLIDIHSQHQTLKLTDNNFQFQVIDAIGDVREELSLYQDKLSDYLLLKKELKSLIEFQQQADKDYDYNSFLLEELKAASLTSGVLADLDARYDRLRDGDEIATRGAQAVQLLGEEHNDILPIVDELMSGFHRLDSFGKSYKDLADRIESVLVELDEVYN